MKFREINCGSSRISYIFWNQNDLKNSGNVTVLSKVLKYYEIVSDEIKLPEKRWYSREFLIGLKDCPVSQQNPVQVPEFPIENKIGFSCVKSVTLSEEELPPMLRKGFVPTFVTVKDSGQKPEKKKKNVLDSDPNTNLDLNPKNDLNLNSKSASDIDAMAKEHRDSQTKPIEDDPNPKKCENKKADLNDESNWLVDMCFMAAFRNHCLESELANTFFE
jgi:hypothetical protein